MVGWLPATEKDEKDEKDEMNELNDNSYFLQVTCGLFSPTNNPPISKSHVT